MAVSTQSRKSEQTVLQNRAETLESPSLREACLSVRLWSAPTHTGQAPSLWENNSPAACLTLDLIATSGGLPMARRGDVLVASFTTFMAAAMTARRLQWALQGYVESEEPRTTSLALQIHSPEEGAGNTVAQDPFQSLAQASNGAILLTEKASQPFDRQPGFPLQVAAGDGLWELDWKGPNDHYSRSEDEEFLSRIAAEQGVEEAPPEPPAPQPAAEEIAEEEYRTGSHRTGSYRTGSYRQPVEVEAKKGSKVWIGAAAAAAIVVVAVLIHVFAGRSNSAPPADLSTVSTAPQTQTAPGPTTQAATTVPNGSSSAVQPKHPAENTPAAKPTKNATKPEAQPAQEAPQEKPRPVEPAKQSKPDNSRCDLDRSQFDGQIDAAWKNLGRGKYAAAKRQFSAVLDCDPGNAKAKEGLERAKEAADAEGGSGN
ncbi:MAG: hypothetical protein WB424_06445 [Terracidiphilus sp.]